MATIEDFFLARYEQMEKENKELRDQLKKFEGSDKYGVFVSNKEVKAVYIKSLDKYSLFTSSYSTSKIASWKPERLKTLLGDAPSRYEELGLIDVTKATFVAEIEFRLVGNSYVRFVMLNRDSLETVASIDDIKADGADEYLGSWCTEECFDYLMSAARDKVQDLIVKRIEELEEAEV